MLFEPPHSYVVRATSFMFMGSRTETPAYGIACGRPQASKSGRRGGRSSGQHARNHREQRLHPNPIGRVNSYANLRSVSDDRRQLKVGVGDNSRWVSDSTLGLRVIKTKRRHTDNAAPIGNFIARVRVHAISIKSNYFTGMCSGSEAGSYFRLMDVCISLPRA